MTDCEFVSIRYSGKPAKFLRGFRAIYIGMFMNMIVIGWVNLAMVTILKIIFPDFTFFGFKETLRFFTYTDAHGTAQALCVISPHLLAVGCLMFFVAIYSALSGLMGVSITDTVQFVIAMAGCIILAVFAVRQPEIGGLSGLKEKLPEWVFQFTPAIGQDSSAQSQITGLFKMSLTSFVAYIGIQWWASWYPGAEPGGGGYVAQRMMSAKDEKHSLFATLWFNIAHFAVRPWPWIIIALCSMVMFPDLTDKREGFVLVMTKVLPAGLVGLLMAAFLAAYMSTIASQTVLGTSYIINDLYRPFIRPGADEKSYVRISRITTFLLLALSLFVTSMLNSISGAWQFILACSGGIGLVLILRWFWWRINAWSEIAALVAPFFVYPIVHFVFHIEFPNSLLIIVAFSTIIWLVVTLLTSPEKESVLIAFYRKVHPGGVGWKPIARKIPDIKGDKGYHYMFIGWLSGSLLILCMLFGLGKLLFGEPVLGALLLALAGISLFVVYVSIAKLGWEKLGQ